MIKCEGGSVEIRGSRFTLLAELVGLVTQMYKMDAISKTELELIVKTATKSDEELKEEMKKMDAKLSPLMRAFADTLTDMAISGMKGQRTNKENDKANKKDSSMDLFNNLFGEDFFGEGNE